MAHSMTLCTSVYDNNNKGYDMTVLQELTVGSWCRNIIVQNTCSAHEQTPEIIAKSPRM
jgi:hypothetical protein